MKKKIALRSVIPAQAGISLLALTLLVACGDTVENVYQTGLEAYASEDDLPKCNKEHENELAFVKDAGVALVCVDGDWVATSPESTGNVDFSCKTEELKDKSGLKIVCNGDSIGVVLNGSDGKDGEKGDKGDDGVDGKDGEDAGMTQSDTMVNDSEKVAISLDSLAGYTQKGPFLKGSTVYLYELSDGRTLKQTNGNFTSKITRDDGHYKFTARDLVSQYAMLVVDGFYRNEVTGEKSDASLRLTALTDMRKRSSANVNLLTHLEFDRVYQLVTRGDSTGKKLTVKQAKRQAQKEILKQFHIELDSTTDAEDMDVFGFGDADAALLAVSILLQGDSGTTDLSVLLTEISNDIAEYGEWRDSAKKAKIADWAMVADIDGRLAIFDTNVVNWGLSTTVPDFAKYVHNYWKEEKGIEDCTSAIDGKVIATKDGKNRYYCSENSWIKATGWSWDYPKEIFLNPVIEYDTMIDPRDKKVYKIVTIAPEVSEYSKTWMAENLNYADSSKTPSLKGKSWCYANVAKNCDVGGRLYTWAAAIDSVKLATDADNPQECGYRKTCTMLSKVQGMKVRGICPEGWHLPSWLEWNNLVATLGGFNLTNKILKSQVGWMDNANGTDAFGFAAIPAGYRYYGGGFYDGSSNAWFWSSTDDDTMNSITSTDEKDNPNHAMSMQLTYNELAHQPDTDKNYALSVRCVKD